MHLGRAAARPRDVPSIHVPALAFPETGGSCCWHLLDAGEWDARRAVPFDLLRHLAMKGVRLFMVQRDRVHAPSDAPVTELPYPDDVYGTARS